MATGFREVVNQLKASIAGARAVVTIGPDGTIDDYFAIDPSFDIETFASEYATLLRIARHACEDMRSGDLLEHVLLSQHSITLARSFSSSYLVIVSDVKEQMGRVRYELRRAVRILERTMPVGS